ncbi:MAG: indolepyruvate oxidoreductase subunit beta [Thermoguttaceae bacterium]|nr:indolepyruvate oxidoreductase subunit beta [Thermoguttaceae bacterium]MBP3695402.1 indolepyruvate oxidoreductase subunit beta [Thermoguttaceae bacterium]
MNKTTSIVLAGVGGQGILLASEILAKAAGFAGFDVKTNEVHGMAQRGGSVIGQIRYGEKVFSPLVSKGEATVLMSLERIEALRYADFLSPDGLAVVNSQVIIPTTVSSGSAVYPENAKEILKQSFKHLVYLDANRIAQELGNPKCANVVLLGALSTKLENLTPEIWEQAIRECVKPKFIDLNITAFQTGAKAPSEL